MLTGTIAELFLRTSLPNMLLLRSTDALLWGVVIFGALAMAKYSDQKKATRWILLGPALSVILCEVLTSLLFHYSWRAALRVYSGMVLVESCLLSALLGSCVVWIYNRCLSRR